jgi:hypothetical protein
MTDKTSIPVVGELLGYLGAGPTIFVSIGLAFIARGLWWDRYAMVPIVFGFDLIFFGLVGSYTDDWPIWICHKMGFEWCDIHQADGRKHLHISRGRAIILLLMVFAILGLSFALYHRVLFGVWPLGLPN